MKRMNLNVWLLAGAVMATGALGVSAQAPAPFKRTVLQQGDLSVPGHEAIMALAEIQPGAAIGRHTHPGEEIAYVLAGPVSVEIEGKPTRTLQTGEAFMVPAGTIHNARNPGPGIAKIVATYVVEKGKPSATPAP
jgi:quercetin dioxygenase-like cupin family protein